MPSALCANLNPNVYQSDQESDQAREKKLAVYDHFVKETLKENPLMIKEKAHGRVGDNSQVVITEGRNPAAGGGNNDQEGEKKSEETEKHLGFFFPDNRGKSLPSHQLVALHIPDVEEGGAHVYDDEDENKYDR